jgi:hypothetical protein
MLDSPPRSKIAPRTPGWFAGNPPQPQIYRLGSGESRGYPVGRKWSGERGRMSDHAARVSVTFTVSVSQPSRGSLARHLRRTAESLTVTGTSLSGVAISVISGGSTPTQLQAGVAVTTAGMPPQVDARSRQPIRRPRRPSPNGTSLHRKHSAVNLDRLAMDVARGGRA